MSTQKTVTEILATGLTQKQLAEIVPCSASAIAAFAIGQRGSNVSFVIGSRLAQIHAERCQLKANKTKKS